MEFVVDTNIIAAAITRGGMTRSLILRPDLKLHSPEFMRAEVAAHEKEFLEKSRLEEVKFRQAAEIVFRNLHEAAQAEYSDYEKEAKTISPDENDWPFFALAIVRKCRI